MVACNLSFLFRKKRYNEQNLHSTQLSRWLISVLLNNNYHFISYLYPKLRCLGLLDILAIGISATLGSGIYVLGTVYLNSLINIVQYL